MLSIPHLMIIFLVALIVLGPEKLPQVARVLGKAMADFRRITTDFRSQIEDEMRDIERQTREREVAAAAAAQAPVLPAAEPAQLQSESIPTGKTTNESAPAEKSADGQPHPA